MNFTISLFSILIYNNYIYNLKRAHMIVNIKKILFQVFSGGSRREPNSLYRSGKNLSSDICTASIIYLFIFLLYIFNISTTASISNLKNKCFRKKLFIFYPVCVKNFHYFVFHERLIFLFISSAKDVLWKVLQQDLALSVYFRTLTWRTFPGPLW